jgi:phage terminase small subunit
MGSVASNLQDLVHGRAADRAGLRLRSRENGKIAKLQKKAPNVLKSLDAELK